MKRDGACSPGRRLMARLDAFARFSDEEGRLTRLYLSNAHRAGGAAICRLVRRDRPCREDRRLRQCLGALRGQDAGRARADDRLAYRHGARRRPLRRQSRRARRAGVVEELARGGERLDVAVEIVAFGDEEGVRFPTTLTGSRAFAGLFARASLDQKDADGISMREALTNFGCEPEAVATLRGRNVAAFVELHIEQGPVLEAENLPIGIVTAINGATRFHCYACEASPAMPARRR